MAATTSTGKAGGKANLIVTIGALTVLAVIGGGLVGKLVADRLRAAPATPPAAAAAAPMPYASDTEVRELAPIVTNLADPASARMRLQVAIVFPKTAVAEDANVLSVNIADDLVAFVKTLTLAQLQGASGLQDLREDLNERAAVRSQGKVREVVIEALVVQ